MSELPTGFDKETLEKNLLEEVLDLTEEE